MLTSPQTHARVARPQLETCDEPTSFSDVFSSGLGRCELSVGKLLVVIGVAVVIICAAIACCCKKKQTKRLSGEAELPSASTPAPADAVATPSNAGPLIPTGLDHIAIAIAEPAPSPVHNNLQAELSQLKMPELRKRAREEGVAEDAIEVRALFRLRLCTGRRESRSCGYLYDRKLAITMIRNKPSLR